MSLFKDTYVSLIEAKEVNNTRALHFTALNKLCKKLITISLLYFMLHRELGINKVDCFL